MWHENCENIVVVKDLKEKNKIWFDYSCSFLRLSLEACSSARRSWKELLDGDADLISKIPQTGDKASLDRCG